MTGAILGGAIGAFHVGSRTRLLEHFLEHFLLQEIAEKLPKKRSI
jgi:hypothetical protein